MTHSKTPFSLLFFLIFLSSQLYAQKKLLILDRSEHKLFAMDLGNPDVPVDLASEGFFSDTYDFYTDQNTGEVFWTDGLSHQVLSSSGTDLANLNPAAISSDDASIPIGLDLDYMNQKIYWVDNIGKRILRSNTDGSEQETVPTMALSNPSCIALWPEMDLLFYADSDSNKIWVSDLEGGNQKVLVKDKIDFPTRMAVSPANGKLYWSDDGMHMISRIDLNGSNQEPVYLGGDDEYPFDLLLDIEQGIIYWTDYGQDNVKRMNLDGDEISILLESDLHTPIALAFAIPLSEKSDEREQNMLSEKPSISAFPNPALQTIAFQSGVKAQDIEWIKIYDRLGHQISVMKPKTSFDEFDVSTQADGLYHYVVQINGCLLSGHFTVIH